MKKVKGNRLLIFAGMLWCIAGFNVLRIGVANMITYWASPVLSLSFSLITFGLFTKLIFSKMVNKHYNRIAAYENKETNLTKILDGKGFGILIFMVTIGVLFRRSNLINPLYLGAFYAGLGTSLFCAGSLFIFKYYQLRVRYRQKNKSAGEEKL
ncbi:MAG: hypothetical protein AWM53_00587 [Candidatus Dichloromethanomonas elyunquensis]|nr:MAG: hypothetical protein AWM53_00587 [Candidatus Dichloromethanomonas elyunquensis]